MTATDRHARQLLRRGVAVENATLGWNVIGLGLLAVAAVRADCALVGWGAREVRVVSQGAL